MTDVPHEASPSFAEASAFAAPSGIERPASTTASIAATSGAATASIVDESSAERASDEASLRPMGVGPSLHATAKSAAHSSNKSE